METIGELIRKYREGKGLLLRQVASILEIDPSLLSKIERGDKKPTKEHIKLLAKIFDTEEKELMVAFLSDKLVYEIINEDCANEALKVAEQKIKYLKK